MGIYSKFAKFEELLEQHIGPVNLAKPIYICDLPEKYRIALKQMGYTDKGIFFGLMANIDNKFRYIIKISIDNNMESITDLLYKDVKTNWYWSADTEEDLNKYINNAYKSLQRWFMFLDIYIKQREQMVRLIKMEWDSVNNLDE